MSKSSSIPSPRVAENYSSSHSASGIRPKHLGLHEFNLPRAANASRAPALDLDRNERRDSVGKIATLLLRRSRDVLDLTQDETAALVEKHPTIIGRRERDEVSLGPLRDWVLMLREMVRTNGPESAAAFMAEFIEAIAAKDLKK